MSNESFAPFVDLMKVLAHPARLRILALLRKDELCVCQIVEVLGLAASTASEHLTELRKAGLLAERREGRWVHYTVNPRPGLAPLLEALWPHVDAVAQVAQDREALRITRGIPLEVTCAKVKPAPVRARKESTHAL